MSSFPEGDFRILFGYFSKLIQYVRVYYTQTLFMLVVIMLMQSFFFFLFLVTNNEDFEIDQSWINTVELDFRDHLQSDVIGNTFNR